MESKNTIIKEEFIEEEYSTFKVHSSVSTSVNPEILKREMMSPGKLVSPQSSTSNVDTADINNSMKMLMNTAANPQDRKAIKQIKQISTQLAQCNQSRGTDISSAAIPKNIYKKSKNTKIKEEFIEEEYSTFKVHSSVSTSVNPEILKREMMSPGKLVSPQSSTSNVDTADINNSMKMLMNTAANPQDRKAIKQIKQISTQLAQCNQSRGTDISSAAIPKNIYKKGSEPDQYDSFIDALMVKLRRQFKPLSVTQPSVNILPCPIFGTGRVLSEQNFISDDLIGTVGSCHRPGESDYYNTRPFGNLESVSPAPQGQYESASGFYYEEFEHLKFESDIL